MPRLTLSTPVQYIKGVGPLRALQFERLGIRTVADLIQHYPFRYEVQPESVAIGKLRFGEPATIIGSVRKLRRSGGMRQASVVAIIEDGTGQCRARWFNSPFVTDRLRIGDTVRLSGKVGQFGDLAQIVNPQFAVIEDHRDPFEFDVERQTPVYPATDGLKSALIAKVIREAMAEVADAVTEYLPDWIRAARRFPPLHAAMMRYHQPTKGEDVEIARRRLAYDELLVPLLSAQLKRRSLSIRAHSEPLRVNAEVDRRIRARLPFVLTTDQDRCVAEISADLAQMHPMNRLLQGDVGSGKTAVALYAALAAIANKVQVIFLVPTEILARQHFAKISKYLEKSRVSWSLLLGATPAGERAKILKSAADGSLDLLVGTHAILERDVRFKHLGLVIVDEQHRFGVAQRAAAKRKASHPHTLVLSATPIPRSLAMTYFGDLDVSVIQTMPPGRRMVATRLITQEEEAWTFVRQRVAAGDQAYVVYPLVDASENLDLKAVNVEAGRLRGEVFPDATVDVVHGRLAPAERDQAMSRFQRGETQILIATTVIEVGVDVPNATVMVVQHAERFGLSQLHQLRGRVGRGTKPSYCLLVTDKQLPDETERLRILAKTHDGFRIAYEDLRRRGPGSLLGTRQHGFPALRVADLERDGDVLTMVRDDVAQLLRVDPTLSHTVHRPLRNHLIERMGEAVQYLDIG